MKKNFSKQLLIFAGSVAVGALLARRKKLFDYRGKVVYITGGSRGLGLSLAWNLLKDGASVALVARDLAELERGKEILLGTFPEAQIFISEADVTDVDQLKRSFQETCAHFGRVDLLVNNAGAIVVGPFAAMEMADFEAQIRLHLYAVINAIKIAMPHFQEQGGGRILNICSLGGKFGVPHMSTYDASKFALAGFAQGVQPELALDNVIMTTAFPTVMRTGSPIQAVFKGDQKKEFKVFEAMDNLPGLSMSADKAAKKILAAVAEGRTEVVLSLPAKARVVLGAVFPELMNSVMQIATRLLPNDNSTVRKTGADSAGRRRPTDDEIMYNQKPKHDAEHNMGIDTLH